MFKPQLVSQKKQEILKQQEKDILGGHKLEKGEQIGTIVFN